MPLSPTVSSAYLKSFYQSALQLGVLKSELPEIPDGWVEGLDVRTRRYPTQLLLDVMQAGYKKTGDLAIGLRFGLNLRPERNIDAIYALGFCNTLKDAMELNIAYQPLIQQIGVTKLVVTDEFAKCIWTPHKHDFETLRFMTEAVFAGYASIGSWLLWTNNPPIKAMRFRHSAPENLDIYETVFGKNIQFNADIDELEFHPDALKSLLPARNPEMVKRLRVQMDQMLNNLKNPNNLIDDIKAQIKGDIKSGPVSIKSISTKLAMSERTLRRRLSEEDTSFRELLAICRRDLAEIYMQDKRMTLAQIAQSLSFGDQSSFSRAFKDWFGVSPREYRLPKPPIDPQNASKNSI